MTEDTPRPLEGHEPLWVRDSRVLWRDVVDGVVLLPPEAPEPLVLDLPGALLWQQLDTPRTAGQLAERLAAVCQEPPERITDALPATLADLREREAVRCLDGR